jgi:hypothetical protein
MLGVLCIQAPRNYGISHAPYLLEAVYSTMDHYGVRQTLLQEEQVTHLFLVSAMSVIQRDTSTGLVSTRTIEYEKILVSTLRVSRKEQKSTSLEAKHYHGIQPIPTIEEQTASRTLSHQRTMPKYQMIFVHEEFMHSSGVWWHRLLLNRAPIKIRRSHDMVRTPAPKAQGQGRPASAAVFVRRVAPALRTN